MAFVNTSESQKTQESNCAFCSAAGAVNLTRGYSEVTSSDVAEKLGVGQSALQSAKGGQAENIIKFVKAETKRKCCKLVENETTLITALDEMKKQPSKTVFALHVSGKITDNGKVSHWLNALSLNGPHGRELRFFDFQTNRDLPRGLKSAMRADPSWVGSKNPASSLSPFVGIVGQDELSADKQKALLWGREPDTTAHRAMHGAVQAGTFQKDHSTAVEVLAFPP